MTTKSGHGYVTRDWADGTYTFRLAWGAWKEIHEKCGCGPNELLERLIQRRWLSSDLFEIIRLGLIGGGEEPVQALKLARTYVQERPLLESVPVVIEIVSASLFGPPEEAATMGETRAAESAAEPSASQPSTETVQ